MMTEESRPFFRELAPLARALGLFVLIGAGVGFALGAASCKLPLEEYFSTNQLDRAARTGLLVWLALGSGVAALGGALAFFKERSVSGAAERAFDRARRLSPLALSGFLPVLFRWHLWSAKPVDFLVLCGLFMLATLAAFRSAESAPELELERRIRDATGRVLGAVAARTGRFHAHLPLAVVMLAALAYTIYFSYYTLSFYYSVRSGYDLALENNLMWNLVHAGPFFKSSPLVGPVGTHFGYHATLFAFVMAPIYALYPHAETLLVLQSFLLGGAAVPLYLFGRRHIAPWAACWVSLTYLLYPALHGPNLYEFHYLPLGMFFIWWALYFLEGRRDRLAAVFIALTLLVREDVSAWVMVVGAYLLLSGRRPVAGVVLGVIGAVYFGTLKFAIMPRFAVDGGESFTFIFQGLIPPGSHGFGAVLATVFGNPAFTLSSLLTQVKLIYLLQLLLPLAFLPFRRPLGILFFAPGFLFSLISTDYWPTVSITYQYGAHWMAFLFPGAILALAYIQSNAAPGRSLWPALLALVATSVPVSYQFGAILQQNTALGGPIKYTFGVDPEGEERHRGLYELLPMLPADGKVSCGAFVTPQLSSRPDAYSMTLGMYDADYIVVPSVRAEFIGNELETVTGLLNRGEFGVVAVRGPFALAKKGHPTTLNAPFLQSVYGPRGRAPRL